MSVKLHRQAEALMGEADILTAAGCLSEARARWLAAARLEAEVFETLPKDRARTRGIIAVSAVELYRRAGDLDEAIRLKSDYLAHGDLPDAWRNELEALVIRGESNGTAKASGVALASENGPAGSALHPPDHVANCDVTDDEHSHESADGGISELNW